MSDYMARAYEKLIGDMAMLKLKLETAMEVLEYVRDEYDNEKQLSEDTLARIREVVGDD